MENAVCALIIRIWGVEEQILCVSRKNNPEDFGLPGGKIESGEEPVDALHRELEEETGLVLHTNWPPFLLYEGACGDRTVSTFYCMPPAGQKIEAETGTLYKWMTWDELCAQGSFKDYNVRLREVYEQHIKDITGRT